MVATAAGEDRALRDARRADAAQRPGVGPDGVVPRDGRRGAAVPERSARRTPAFELGTEGRREWPGAHANGPVPLFIAQAALPPSKSPRLPRRLEIPDVRFR